MSRTRKDGRHGGAHRYQASNRELWGARPGPSTGYPRASRFTAWAKRITRRIERRLARMFGDES